MGFAGLAASTLGFGAAVLGCIYALRAARGGPLAPAVTLLRVAFGALLAAGLIMEVALVTHDFSVAYVAQVGSRETPVLYTVASLWGALDGSLLFWAVLLAGVTALLTWRTSAADRGALPHSLTVLAALLGFFAFIVVGPGSPWGRVDPVPLDGPGPNPLLQNNPLVAIHPPLLYLGFVALAVPFALTVAALWQGRLDAAWLRVVRRWMLGSWIALSLALTFGAWWSYAVLGWGGYWAWDPVENVALLPWLTATAFLHSAMVQARGGRLASWNVVLVVASFALTLLATLVTRSGILVSVHSFTESAIGPLFLALLSVVLVGSAALVTLRLAPAESRVRLGTRPAVFLLNNLLFVAIAGTVLLGTLFPLIAEVVGAGQLSVGAPYFERVVGPLALALVVLAGVGPTLPWGTWDASARRRLLPGTGAAAVVALVLLVEGVPVEAIAGVAAGTFALVASGWSIAHRLRPMRSVGATGRRRAQLGSRRRTLGGLVAHMGVALVALAIVANGVGRRDLTATLLPGAATTLGPYTLTYLASRTETQGGLTHLVADARAIGPGGPVALAPSLTLFPIAGEAIPSPAVVASWTGDLYVTLANVDPASGAATFQIGVHPFISWLWVGGLVTGLGGAVAFWPSRRRAAGTALAAEPAGRPMPADA